MHFPSEKFGSKKWWHHWMIRLFLNEKLLRGSSPYARYGTEREKFHLNDRNGLDKFEGVHAILRSPFLSHFLSTAPTVLRMLKIMTYSCNMSVVNTWRQLHMQTHCIWANPETNSIVPNSIFFLSSFWSILAAFIVLALVSDTCVLRKCAVWQQNFVFSSQDDVQVPCSSNNGKRAGKQDVLSLFSENGHDEFVNQIK